MRRCVASLLAVVAAVEGLASRAAGDVSLLPVFVNGDGYPCFRQPALLAFGSTVLAFADGRNNTDCSGLDDGYPTYIVARRSTDGGASFGPLVTLWTGSPDFFVVVREQVSGNLTLFIQQGSSVLYAGSRDGGATWSVPSPYSFTAPFKVFKPAVGHGVQLNGSLCGSSGDSSALDGRLVLPFVCQTPTAAAPEDVACPGCFSCLLTSDDRGLSWQLGAVSPQVGTREAAIVQVCGNASASSSLSVYANERNMGAQPGHREWARSADGGSSFATSGVDTALVEPVTTDWVGIVASVARVDTGGQRRVVFSCPADASERANLTLRVSYDEAETWSAPKTLWAGPSAYSDAQPFNASHFFVLFENGEAQFAERISLATVPVAWLDAV